MAIDLSKLPRPRLSERARTLLRRAVGYPLFFLFAFAFSAYLTFPYELVRDRLVREVARRIPGAELEIVSLAPSRLTGLSLEGVSLRLPSGVEGERPLSLTLPRVWARAGLFSLLFGELSVAFEVEVDGGGRIEGSFEQADDEAHLVAALTGVDLRRIGPLRMVTRLPAAGVVSGELDVRLGPDDDSTNGHVVLSITGASLGDGRAQLVLPGMGTSGVTVEQLGLGDIAARLEIERGTARVEQLTSTGPDAELRGSGSIHLGRPFRMSSLDVLLRANVLSGYRERNDRTRAIFTLVDMSSEVRPYRTADGAFQFRLQGTLGGRILAAPAGNVAMPN